MTTDHRAATWLLTPIALQILHYLNDADEAYAFLAAAPNDSLDDALDALRTLLAMNVELPLWPTAHIASLDAAYNVSPSSVTKALPLFRKIIVTCGQDYGKICHTTKLPPTTTVSASVDAANIRGVLGKWLPNLVALRVVSQSTLAASAVIKDNLSACDGLRALTMDQYEVLLQDTLDTALAVVVAACPHLESFRLRPSSLSTASDYAALLAWLALPTARHLVFDGTEPKGELCAELMTAMLASTTLETIELLEVPILTRAVLSSSSPLLLPQQLRHLKIKDYAKYDDYDSYDDDDSNDDDSDDAYDEANIDEVDVPVDPAPLFGDSDVVALAAKVATSCLESLALRLETRCDVTSVMTALPPTLTKLALPDGDTYFVPAAAFALASRAVRGAILRRGYRVASSVFAFVPKAGGSQLWLRPASGSPSRGDLECAACMAASSRYSLQHSPNYQERCMCPCFYSCTGSDAQHTQGHAIDRSLLSLARNEDATCCGAGVDVAYDVGL